MLAVLVTQVVMISQLCMVSLPITSAHRTPEHNAAVGGVPNSLHLKGQALDVATIHLPEDKKKCVLNYANEIFERVIVYPAHIHVDHGRD